MSKFSKTIALLSPSTKPATYAVNTLNTPNNWYAKRAHAHFATYFGGRGQAGDIG